MVIGPAILCVIALAQPPAPASVARDAEIRQALAKGGYPWYDAQGGELTPVQPPWTSRWWTRFQDWLARLDFKVKGPSGRWNFSLGKLFVYALFFIALMLLIGGLWYAYRAYMPAPVAERVRSKVGGAAAIGGLPSGLEVDLTDPLGEARRLMAAGDYAGAVVCLFVHQLITLDRLRLLRLAPGRTARQLVSSVAEPYVRTRVQGTLRLFEAAYYGHSAPSAEAFQQVWADAEALERRIAEGAFAS